VGDFEVIDVPKYGTLFAIYDFIWDTVVVRVDLESPFNKLALEELPEKKGRL